MMNLKFILLHPCSNYIQERKTYVILLKKKKKRMLASIKIFRDGFLSNIV